MNHTHGAVNVLQTMCPWSTISGTLTYTTYHTTDVVTFQLLESKPLFFLYHLQRGEGNQHTWIQPKRESIETPSLLTQKGVAKMTLVEFIFIPKYWSYPAKITIESESLRKKRRQPRRQSRGSALRPLPPAQAALSFPERRRLWQSCNYL